MTSHPILVLIAVLIFCAWCLIVDADEASAATNNPFLAACRIIARHIKLVLRFLLAVGITFAAIMACFEIGKLVSAPAERAIANGGGPQTERFSHFMNEATWPVQYMLDGFTTILGIIAALTLLSFVKFCHWYLAHARVCNYVLLAFYAIWLVYNVWKIVDEVFSNREIAVVLTVLAVLTVVGIEAATVIHFMPFLHQFHQVVVAELYS